MHASPAFAHSDLPTTLWQSKFCVVLWNWTKHPCLWKASLDTLFSAMFVYLHDHIYHKLHYSSYICLSSSLWCLISNPTIQHSSQDKIDNNKCQRVVGDRAVRSSPEMTGKPGPCWGVCWGAADLAPGRLRLHSTVRAHREEPAQCRRAARDKAEGWIRPSDSPVLDLLAVPQWLIIRSELAFAYTMVPNVLSLQLGKERGRITRSHRGWDFCFHKLKGTLDFNVFSHCIQFTNKLNDCKIELNLA